MSLSQRHTGPPRFPLPSLSGLLLFSSSVASSCFITPWTVALQARLSMGFPRQEHWSGLPFPSPGDLPNPEIKAGSPTVSPALQEDSLLSVPCTYFIAWACVLSHVWLFEISRIVAHQVPLSMEFSRQEYWSGLPFPSPRELPDPGVGPTSLESPKLDGRFFYHWAWEAPLTQCLWHRHRFTEIISVFCCCDDTFRKYEHYLCFGLWTFLSPAKIISWIPLSPNFRGQPNSKVLAGVEVLLSSGKVFTPNPCIKLSLSEQGEGGRKHSEGGGVTPKHGTEERSAPILESNCWNTISSCHLASALALYIPSPFLNGNQTTPLLSPDSSHGFHFIPDKKLCVQSLSHVRLFSDPMGCSSSDSSVHEFFQAGTLEWVAISSSRGSPRPRDQICISYVSSIGTQEAPFHLIPDKWWILTCPNAFISCPLQAAVLPS